MPVIVRTGYGQLVDADKAKAVRVPPFTMKRQYSPSLQ